MSSKIESRQAQSFYDYENLKTKQTQGYERHYIKLTTSNSKETQGVAILNVDHTAVGEYRAFIRHLSTTDISKLQKALEQVVDHIWRTVYCTHIRVELFHISDDTGKMQADPDVKNAFSKVGFKWKTLSNDPATGKRAQIMQLNRFPTSPAYEPKMRHIEAATEPVTIKAGLVLSLSHKPHKMHTVDHGAEKTDKIALVSCIIGSLKHVNQLPDTETLTPIPS